jgi:hypothetical protein
MSKARDIASAPIAPSTVSATELGYVDGVTSAIQTQLDAKTAKSTLTTTGDIYYASAANTPARLGIGSTDQVLKVTGGIPAWATPAGGGGMTLLSTTTLSGTTTTISSIDQTYNDLLMVIKNVAVGDTIFINPNGSTSNTQFAVYSTNQGANVDYTRFRSTTNIKSGNTQNNYVFHWFQYASSSSVKSCDGCFGFYSDQNTYWAGFHGGTFFDNTAISSFTITCSASISGGTVLLYGVK